VTPWPAAELAEGFGPPYLDAAGEIWPAPLEAPEAEAGDPIAAAEAQPFGAFLGAGLAPPLLEEPTAEPAPRAAEQAARRQGERGWIIRR
jgi:hypothetical protein